MPNPQARGRLGDFIHNANGPVPQHFHSFDLFIAGGIPLDVNAGSG
jgi:hypothetical protein